MSDSANKFVSKKISKIAADNPDMPSKQRVAVAISYAAKKYPKSMLAKVHSKRKQVKDTSSSVEE